MRKVSYKQPKGIAPQVNSPTFRIMDIDYIKRRGKGQTGQKRRKMRENDKKKSGMFAYVKKKQYFCAQIA